MRSDIGGADRLDDADAVLPPPREHPVDPDDQLWHTSSFATITDRLAVRRKLAAGLAVLGGCSVAVCGYAGVELAGLAGLAPPSAPRYVITDQAHTQPGVLPQREAEPAPERLPGKSSRRPAMGAGPVATGTAADRAGVAPSHESGTNRDKPAKPKKRKRRHSDD